MTIKKNLLFITEKSSCALFIKHNQVIHYFQQANSALYLKGLMLVVIDILTSKLTVKGKRGKKDHHVYK